MCKDKITLILSPILGGSIGKPHTLTRLDQKPSAPDGASIEPGASNVTHPIRLEVPGSIY